MEAIVAMLVGGAVTVVTVICRTIVVLARQDQQHSLETVNQKFQHRLLESGEK